MVKIMMVIIRKVGEVVGKFIIDKIGVSSKLDKKEKESDRGK